MYSFSEDTVITGALSARMGGRARRRRVAILGSAQAEGSVRGRLRAKSERLVQAAGAPPGTFTITAVEPERMRASEAGILRPPARREPLPVARR